MPRLDVSSLSLEEVQVRVIGKRNGSVIDPTGGAVSMAFLPSGETPDVDDWHDASWETAGSNTYYAVCSVGPSSDVGTLDPGSYRIWVKWSVNNETPVKMMDSLYIY